MEAHRGLPTHQQLLDTSAEDVPDDVRTSVARACDEVPGVRAAYAARVRQSFGGDDPAVEGLQIGYELIETDGRRDLGVALIRALPRELSRSGVYLLADAALPAWRNRGVQIFAR